MKRSEFLFTFGRILSDGIMIFLGLMLAYFLRMRWFEFFELAPPTTLFPLESFSIFSLKITFVLLLVMAFNGRYKFYADEKIWDEILHVFWSFSAGMALILIVFFFSRFLFFSRFIFGVSWVTGLLLVLTGRVGLRKTREKIHEWGYGRIKILLLGTGKIAQQALDFLRKSPKYELVGALSEVKISQKTFQGLQIIGNFREFESVLKKYQPDEVIVASENASEKITSKLVRLAHINHVKFRFLPDELGLDLAAVTISTLGNLPLISLQSTRLGRWGYVIKSFIDYIVALAGVLLLSPLLAIIAWRVKRENKKAPILYVSPRIGRNGKEFPCFKFRTMIPDADQKKKKLLKKNQRKGGVLFKLDDDPRVTKLGRILRKWSLDELPQLFNVLRGEMSLIGPRPHLPEEVKKYGKDDHRVFWIKPGLTGFAQINGRSKLSFEEEMNYELFYLKNWSLWLDLIIFLKSIWVVLQRKNVS
ncbi:sugar transferase [Candidatus Gracilibacteria bacterium]|nr:sugar transferase [Candidatus Gracilibacteria bacterium]MCF7819828.1 sugar transferase [Candidatus Gracilibacteria bacterium]